MKIDINKLEQWIKDRFDFKPYKEDYLINTPYRPDKNFKLSISPSKACFHCWKSDESGPLWKFVMYIDKCTKKEAINKIYHVDTDINDFDSIIDNLKSKLNETKFISQSKNIIPKSFKYLSLDDNNKTNISAIEYCIHERAINPFKWKFGYCTEILKNRVIIPCFDKNNNWIYWTARSLDKNNKLRYINPGEEDYHVAAQNVIFTNNWNFKNKTIFLVEGIFDAIALIELGFHAVSILGKILTYEKYLLIKEAKEIVLALDNNSPGIQATNQIEEYLHSNGFDNIKYVFTQDQKDWSQSYKENKKELKKYINSNIKNFDLKSKISIILRK